MATISEALAKALQFHRAGELVAAQRIYAQILAVDGEQADALQLSGLIAHQQGQSARAVELMQRAIAVRGTDPTFYYNLGVVWKDQKMFASAQQAFARAVQLKPDFAAAYYNLGTIYSELLQYVPAVDCYLQSIQHDPHDAESFNNLGSAYKELGKFEEAYAAFEQALRLNPQYSIAKFNLGVVHMVRGEYDQALAIFQALIAKEPQVAEWHLYSGMVLLMQGRLEAGWQEYEWRLQAKVYGTNVQQYRKPCWRGESLSGKTLLLHGEQGLGDSIQFIRYASLLKQQGAKILFHGSARLEKIFKTVRGIDQFIPEGELLPEYDFYLPLLSTPHRLGTTLETIPSEESYLNADLELVSFWRDKLCPYQHAFRVGINWRGGQGIPAWQWRDVPLEFFAPLARIPGVQCVRLQQGTIARDESTGLSQIRMVDYGDEVDQAHGAFMDTAAIMKNLDLVITSDTSIAHLAGALGVRTWVALPFSADWRWLLHREDTPWYPTMRLFRQQRANDWESVFTRIHQALQSIVADHRS
jgi:tetratricopeptide (TPR) repeat protein